MDFAGKKNYVSLIQLKKKKGGFLRRPVLKYNVRSALLIAPYDEAIASLEYNNVKKKVDLSSSSQSTKRAVAIYPSDKGVVAVTFELTPKSATLISSFCENSKKLKEITK